MCDSNREQTRMFASYLAFLNQCIRPFHLGVNDLLRSNNLLCLTYTVRRESTRIESELDCEWMNASLLMIVNPQYECSLLTGCIIVNAFIFWSICIIHMWRYPKVFLCNPCSITVYDAIDNHRYTIFGTRLCLHSITALHFSVFYTTYR